MLKNIHHLAVIPKGKTPQDGFKVDLNSTEIDISKNPSPGTSYVNIQYSAVCGSDGGPHGYYWGGRFHRDLFEGKEKLQENIFLLKKESLKAPDKSLITLLRTPNHEGSGVVTASTPNSNETVREIAAFLPTLSLNKREITGLHYERRFVNFQDIKKGQRVVVDAALRCDDHGRIVNNAFPEDCHRSTEGGHVRKRVPGHMEFPGFSYQAPYGLPYPNHMLSAVPDMLNKWIDKNPLVREKILVGVEPLSCCIEAFHPILMSGENPKCIAILGDGPNAAFLSFVASTAFPEASIFVIGRTDAKLRTIFSFNPEKIHIIKEGKSESEIGHVQLKKILKGKKLKLDVLVPTIELESLSDYSEVVHPTGRVIVWAAGQVGQTNPFKGVGDPQKLHHSYGGKNKMEWSALQLLDALVYFSPKRLDAFTSYPYHIVPFKDAQKPMEEWLNNKGKYSIEMDGRRTSAKIIFAH